MFKSILVPIDGSEYAETARRYAIQAARVFDASLRILYVVDVKKLASPLLNDVAVCLGIAAVPNLQETYRENLVKMGETALEMAEKECTKAKVECQTILKSGIVSDVICQEAHTVDLVVMGHRGEASEWGSRLLGSVFEATIRQINRPAFIVSKFQKGISRILSAYDGSHQASNALRVVTDVCSSQSLPLHVLIASETGEVDENLIEEVTSYLSSYEVDWRLEKGVGDPAEVIIAKAKEINADVIAMGAYGHSRIKELLVGSTTEYVLRNATCPILVYR